MRHRPTVGVDRVWMWVQASPPVVVVYLAALVFSRWESNLGASLSTATVLLSVVLHSWLRVRGQRQAAAHVTCAALLTFEIIWLCQLLLMEVDDLRRWSRDAQDSAAIIALGLCATGFWIGSQRRHLSREVYAGTIVSWLCLEGAVRTVTFFRTADDPGPRVLFCIATGSLVLGARAADSQGLISNAPTEYMWVVIQSTLFGVMFYLVVAPLVVQWELRTGVFLLSSLM